MSNTKSSGKEDNTVNEVVKRKSNKAITFGDNGFDIEPGDNSRTIKQLMGIYNMPKIDINNSQEVDDRIKEYFEYCFNNDLKPGVEGMAMAIGVSRSTLWDWEVGRSRNLGTAHSDVIKKAKQFLANYLENLGQSGKINPVTFIFLMKNHNGYVDKQDITITPNQQLDAGQTPDEIQKQIESDIPIDMDDM